MRRIFSQPLLRQARQMSTFEHIRVDTNDSVGVMTLNRPKALNALCDGLFQDLLAAAQQFNDNDAIGCLVVTGGDSKAFAAGADISEMKDRTMAYAYSKVCTQ